MRKETPAIFDEITDKVLERDKLVLSRFWHELFALAGQYGDESEDLSYRKEIMLDTMTPTKVKIFAKGFTSAIGLESEVLNRYLLIDDDAKIVESAMPYDPANFSDDLVDRPIVHVATGVEISDFKKLFELAKEHVSQRQPVKRTLSDIKDRHWERALAGIKSE